jgi:hypothetical protein
MYDADCVQPPEAEEGGKVSSSVPVVPMFLSLNDAVQHAVSVVKAAKLDDVALVVGGGDADAATLGGGVEVHTSHEDYDHHDMSWARTAVAVDE